MAAFGLMATACGNLDNPLEDIQGSGNSSSENNSEDEVIAKYEFKVTDLKAVPTDLTSDITSLTMTKTDGTNVATATVDAEGITITANKLEGVTADDYWFEATTATGKYVAKVNVNPTALDPETPITLAMATLGDLVGADGNFYVDANAITAAETKAIGVIAYLGNDKFTENGTDIDDKPFVGHGLVLCLKNAAKNTNWGTENELEFSGEVVGSADDLKRTENVSGYKNTKTLATRDNAESKFTAAYKAYHYGEGEGELVAPTSTTGWFMPSAQQWVKIVEDLGGLSENDIKYLENMDTDQKGINSLENMIKKAGTGNYDTMLTQLRYWSSSERSDTYAISLEINGNPDHDWGFYFHGNIKNVDIGQATEYRVRPILAF